ncbi:MAG: VanW family protein [Oscillospiraceae bacterium]|nr:VanW family protein [Oscillospiraceae bacterium]
MKIFGSSSSKGKRQSAPRSGSRAEPAHSVPEHRAPENRAPDNREPARVYASAHAYDTDAVPLRHMHQENPPGKTPKAAKPAKKPVTGAKKFVRVASIILLVLLVCAAGVAAGFGYYVNNVDTIFPNVSVEGFDLSGLTFQEATDRLIAHGYEANADNISATIVFPEGVKFSVTAVELGLSRNAREAATVAFSVGRGGSIIDKSIAYAQALLEPTEINYLNSAHIDDSIIRTRVSEYTNAFNSTIHESELEINSSEITFVKGSAFQYAVESDVFDLMMFTLQRAIEENAHLTANYMPTASTGEVINLASILAEVHVEPISSEFVYEVIENGDDDSERTLVMGGTESVIGRTFDLEEAEQKLDAAVNGEKIVIPIVDLYPKFTQEQIDDMILRDTLGELTTNIGGNANRLHNITLASNKINGTILLPGEEFSFNSIVGQRTRANGFRDAGGFIGGRLTDVVGGGICQVSSTIYATLLQTAIFGEDILITERTPHSLTISYLPDGRDASIVWGNRNFRFRNMFDFPIKIETIVDGRYMNVRIIGSQVNDYVIEVETVPIRTIEFYTLERESDEVPYGERVLWTPGQRGEVVETFQRLYNADGELISRTLVARDTYNRQDRVTHIGTHVPEDTGYVAEPGSPSVGPQDPTGGAPPPEGETPPPGGEAPGEEEAQG